MGYPNWIERISDVLAEDIRTRTNNPTLNAVLGVVDGAGKSIGGNLGDFQANTNLTNLLAVIGGGFETANKDLHTLLYTEAAAYINNVACPATPVGGSMLDVLVEDIWERTNNKNLNALLGVVDGAGKSLGGNIGDFQANTNLQTLLAVIGGGFETDNVNLYTRLYTGAVAYINDVACPAAPVAGSLLNVLVEGIYERTNNKTLNALIGVTDTAGHSLGGNIGDFMTRTNLQSVLAMLGLPDDANGSLYARLGAFTTAAPLKTTLDNIEVDTKYINDVACPAAPVAGSMLQVLVEDIWERTNNKNLNALLGVADVAGRSLTGNLGDFQAQTNLQTLLAALGIPDVAGKPLYTCLVTDRLDNAVYGLSAIEQHITSATGIFSEQADTPVNITAILASETTVFDLSVASTRYRVLSLRLKAADPSTETMTVRLYELINDVLTVVDTFAIDAANWGTYHSLMDMFGIPHLAGDNLKVTVQMSGGAEVAVTGQYSHSKTNV